MEHDVNQSTSTRRFIFSDEFYDNLDNEVPNEEKVSFDAPQIPPKVETRVEPIQDKIEEEQLPNYFSNTISDLNNNINTNNFETNEPQQKEMEIPTFDFNKIEEIEKPQTIDEPKIETPVYQQPMHQEVEPIINQPKPPEEFKIPKIEEETKIENNLKPLSSYSSSQQDNDIFNVETGINNELEQEIMKPKIEPKIQIVENTNWFEPETQEKIVYRARRNNPTPTKTYTQPKAKVEPTVNQKLFEPINEQNIMTIKDIKPNVINIDEEILKEQELQAKIDNAEQEIIIEENDDVNMPVVKSDLLEQLSLKEQQTGKISILARYGDDFCSRDYVTNPAIGRNEEIKQLILILLTPEKSGILVGKPGIGKTSIVEGLAYRLQRGKVPDALKGYRIVSVKTTSLLGTLPTGETRLQTLIDELKELDKIILFIDEIHMLMGATSESSLDFANMFKESLGRGSIKMIGATTDDEYERYVLRDKAFVRRFQRVDVLEPTKEQTVRILMGTLPKIEKNTGATLKYTKYIQSEIMSFIVDITTEYKRIYGIGSRYPDICLTLLSQAFSQTVFENRREVNILDIRKAIENSKNIYPDVIRKELINFDQKFIELINIEKAN